MAVPPLGVALRQTSRFQIGWSRHVVTSSRLRARLVWAGSAGLHTSCLAGGGGGVKLVGSLKQMQGKC